MRARTTITSLGRTTHSRKARNWVVLRKSINPGLCSLLCVGEHAGRRITMANGIALAATFEGLVEEGEAFRRLSGKPRKRLDVIVIGGGQAGLSVGYHL